MSGACDAEYVSDCPEVQRVLRENRRLNAECHTYRHLERIQRMLRQFACALLARGESHDRSKMHPVERDLFADSAPQQKQVEFGTKEYAENLKNLGSALTHHYACNRHHPEHFENGIDDMNLVDVVEMFIDWYSSTNQNKNGGIHKSIAFNRDRFGMSEQLVKIFVNTVQDYEEGGFFDNLYEPDGGVPRTKKYRPPDG